MGVRDRGSWVVLVMSLAVVTKRAWPSLMSWLVPTETELVMGPGMAKRGFLNFFARVAVMREPDLMPASTTKTPRVENLATVMFL